MEKYLGVKLIEAEPMNLGDYNKFKGWDISKDEDPKKEGYKVKYSDSYISWSPKEEFEKSYKTYDDKYSATIDVNLSSGEWQFDNGEVESDG